MDRKISDEEINELTETLGRMRMDIESNKRLSAHARINFVVDKLSTLKPIKKDK